MSSGIRQRAAEKYKGPVQFMLMDTTLNRLLGNAIDAEIWRSEGGAFIRRTRRYVLDHRHGRCRLGELRQLDRTLAALSTAGKQPLHPQQVPFFDTETTGLGIGAGNVPFMLGYGFLDADRFRRRASGLCAESSGRILRIALLSQGTELPQFNDLLT